MINFILYAMFLRYMLNKILSLSFVIAAGQRCLRQHNSGNVEVWSNPEIHKKRIGYEITARVCRLISIITPEKLQWTHTQTQTKFIQQKQIQIPHPVDMSFTHITNNYDTWHIMNSRHVGRPPLRLYMTTAMEATRKEKHAWQWWKTQCNLMLTGSKNSMWEQGIRANKLKEGATKIIPWQKILSLVVDWYYYLSPVS